MKIRYLTLLTALIFLGFTVSAYAIKPGNDYPKYDVSIDGGWNWYAPNPGIFLPGEGTGWIWNGTQVGSTYADGRTFPLEMTYISPLVGNDRVYGDATPTEFIGYECFDDGAGPDAALDVTFGGFFREKAGKAVGMFWFHGFTKLSMDNRKAVLYQLKIEGTFFPGFNANGFPGNGEVMHMTHWTLTVANQGKNVTSRSCVGSGTFESDDGNISNDFVKVNFEGPN